MKIEKDNLVKLEQHELKQLANGTLAYIEHPEKGVCKADWNNVFINAIELSKEDNKLKTLYKEEIDKGEITDRDIEVISKFLTSKGIISKIPTEVGKILSLTEDKKIQNLTEFLSWDLESQNGYLWMAVNGNNTLNNRESAIRYINGLKTMIRTKWLLACDD